MGSYGLALRKAGAPSPELSLYPDGDHGFGYCKSDFEDGQVLPEHCGWPDRVQVWMQGLFLTLAPDVLDSVQSKTAAASPWWHDQQQGLLAGALLGSASSGCVFFLA